MADATKASNDAAAFTPDPYALTHIVDTAHPVGASNENSGAYQRDRVGVAEQVTAALDPKDDSVGRDAILFQSDAATPDAKTEEKDLKAAAEQVLKDAEQDKKDAEQDTEQKSSSNY